MRMTGGRPRVVHGAVRNQLDTHRLTQLPSTQ
jgi:hypothetical protein